MTKEELFKQLWDHIEAGKPFILRVWSKLKDVYKVIIPLKATLWLQLQVYQNNYYIFEFIQEGVTLNSNHCSNLPAAHPLPDSNMKYTLTELKGLSLINPESCYQLTRFI